MSRSQQVVLFFVGALAMFSCIDELQLMKNTRVGNPNLAITGFSPPSGVLREDTITIYGKDFNPLAYQNVIFFPTVSSEALWVNEQGEVTDSVYTVVSKYSTYRALVVDASTDSIKVIVPTDAVNGPVRVSFGVDTVASLTDYNLLTTELRPKIQSFVPTFGPPGITLNMVVRDGFVDIERMVVSFGSFMGQPFEITGSEGLNSLLVNVPNIFAGPVDLRVGKKLATDTLWSTAINFGILPVEKNVIPLVVTFSGNESGSQAVYGNVGYGEQVNGVTNLVELQLVEDTDSPNGIAYNAGNENVFWLRNNGGSASTLFLGNVSERKGDNSIYDFPQLFSDVVFAKTGTKNYVYVAGKVIRRIEVINQLNPSIPNIRIYADPNPQAFISNLKKVGNTFYWVDNALKRIIKGDLAASGTSLINVVTLYDQSEGLLTPQALAIDQSTNTIFISEYDVNGYRIVKGSIDGTASLTIFQEYEKVETDLERNNLILDLEVDKVNDFLYWSDKNDEGNGVFRKPMNNTAAVPKIIYQFPFAQYIDLIQE